jgi:hypothetical protein
VDSVGFSPDTTEAVVSWTASVLSGFEDAAPRVEIVIEDARQNSSSVRPLTVSSVLCPLGLPDGDGQKI